MSDLEEYAGTPEGGWEKRRLKVEPRKGVTNMARRKMPELMGAKEVARELNVQVSNIDRVSGLPPAFQELASGRVWIAEDIREFAKQRAARKAKRAAA